MNYKVKILEISPVTHNVKRFVVAKPKGYSFVPGQATEVSIDAPELLEERRPFTFTNLNIDDYLEFVIKGYYDHNGITKKIHELEKGSNLVITEPFGTISYSGAGTFIAGGAGITPFISILRKLKFSGKISENKLIFSNKTKKDVILEDELKDMYKIYTHNLILTLTQETREKYENGRIDKNLLQTHIKNYDQHFYICGPKLFVKDIREILHELGAKSEYLVFEK